MLTQEEIKEIVIRHHKDAQVVQDRNFRYVVAEGKNCIRAIGMANYYDPPGEEWISAFRNTILNESQHQMGIA